MSEKSKKAEMPFLDHLEELRWRIIWSVVAILLGSIAGIWFTIRFDLIGVLTAPLFTVVDQLALENPMFVGIIENDRLVNLSLTEPFFFVIRLGVMCGLLLASPIVAYQIWAFLAPALEPRERKAIIPTFVFGLLLFCAGVALAYFVALPITIRFLLQFGAEWFTPALTGGYYMSTVFRLLLAFGLAFELPVVLAVLSALGLVTSRFLKEKRRHAFVLMAILAAAASPGDFPLIMLLMVLPLVLFYELGIALAVFFERRRKEEMDAILGPPDGSESVIGAIALAAYSLRGKIARARG